MKNGFYKALDEIRSDGCPDATFGFLEVAVNLRRFNAFDFLHGYCLDFALVLSEEMGYSIETVRAPNGNLIHAYCIAEDEGEKLYIDVRGVTNEPVLFFEEFEDEVDYADGEFWCLEDQAKVEVFAGPEEYLAAHLEPELFLDYAKAVYDWNWDYYDVVYGLELERKENDLEVIKHVAFAVRAEMAERYQNNLAGHCIEASEEIVKRLTEEFGIEAVTVEGWCRYDDDHYGTDRPWDPHTWVEIPDLDVYVDVTADQFNYGMYAENDFPKVLVQKGLPHGMQYDEPDDEEPYLDDQIHIANKILESALNGTRNVSFATRENGIVK